MEDEPDHSKQHNAYAKTHIYCSARIRLFDGIEQVYVGDIAPIEYEGIIES